MRNKTLKQLMEQQIIENEIKIEQAEKENKESHKEFIEMVDEIIEYIRINLTENKNLN